MTFEVHENRQLLLEDRCGATDGFLGLDGTVGLEIDDQLVEVRALLNPSRFHAVGDAVDRAEGRIEKKHADGARFVLFPAAGVGGLIASTPGHADFHLELSAAVQRRDVVLRIHKLHVLRKLKIRGRHLTSAVLRQREGGFVGAMHANGKALEVQKNLDNVFLYPFDCAVLMLHAIDLHVRDGAAGHGGQQDTAKRIPEGMTEAALERLERYLRTGLADFLNLNVFRRQEFGDGSCHVVTCPKFGYLE